MRLKKTSLISGKSENLFKDLNFQGKVLIIGAGAAGLFAGYTLQTEGIEFEILEASERLGGRLGKIEAFADYSLDRGAEWLHGKKSIMGELVKKTKAKIKRDNSRTHFWFEGQIQKKIARDFLAEMEEDSSLPDISFMEYAKEKGYGDEYADIVEQVAGDYGADSSDISAKWTIKEEEAYSAGFKDYKFRETYFDLVYEHIAQEVSDKIHLNSWVREIDYSQGQLKVYDANGKEYLADKIILTVPITVLQEGDINFIPPLPQDKLDAFRKIGMGAGMKVFLKFKERFYKKYLLGGKICAAYADESIGKNGKEHVLMAFIMGQQAAYLSGLQDDQAVVETLLTELDQIYDGKASTSFIEAHIEDWSKHPYIRGAYSYSKVGIGNVRSIAARQVEEKLFFAGEAMNLNGHHQTVHGAIETGYLKVLELRDSLLKS
ncbi:MAG: NAD(P)/FAD-dependent oxidoreductase [Bacteroidota bacterium]